MPFGLAVALVFQDLQVPAFGWGNWPTETSAALHAYGLSMHAVFGVVLVSGRYLMLAALDQIYPIAARSVARTPAWSGS